MAYKKARLKKKTVMVFLLLIEFWGLGKLGRGIKINFLALLI